MTSKTNQYRPQTVSHPGSTLAERLEELNMGSKEFATRTGKPEKTISRILSGDSAITPDMAVLFEDVLHIPADFWLARQKNYDEAVARIKREELIQESVPWAREFPYAQMAQQGWLTATRVAEEKVVNLFKFFSVGSIKAFEDFYFEKKVLVSFRVSLAHTHKPFAFAAWLRQGELQSKQLVTIPYNKVNLEKSLPQIKALMAEHPSDFFQQLQDICLQAGVKVVYTPCLPGASVDGSTRWLGDIPLIQMSARYKQNDIFWFTFFHEVAHILKHGKKYISLENVKYQGAEIAKEKEADEFAVQWTFSKEEEKQFRDQYFFTIKEIVDYASEIGTHPAMIIGRFHHNGLLHYSEGRELIEKVEIDL